MEQSQNCREKLGETKLRDTEELEYIITSYHIHIGTKELIYWEEYQRSKIGKLLEKINNLVYYVMSETVVEVR